MLGHMRRLARGAGDLTAHEMKKLTKALEKVELRNMQGDLQGKVPLKNRQGTSPKKRTLKKKNNDSKGFPMELKTPQNKPTPAKVTPEKVQHCWPKQALAREAQSRKAPGKSCCRPRAGRSFGLGKFQAKKPAAAKKVAMKKPAAAKVTVKGNDTKASDHRPWLKI